MVWFLGLVFNLLIEIWAVDVDVSSTNWEGEAVPRAVHSGWEQIRGNGKDFILELSKRHHQVSLIFMCCALFSFIT